MRVQPFWTTPKGVTFDMYAEVNAKPEYNAFLNRKKRNKRIRGMVACMVHFDMEIGEEYLGNTLREYLIKYNPKGISAITLSHQKVGSLLTMIARYGILSKRRSNNKTYYRRLI